MGRRVLGGDDGDKKTRDVKDEAASAVECRFHDNFLNLYQCYLSFLPAVSGLEDEDGTLQRPQPPTLPLPLALPTLDLLPRLRGLLGPMEEAAVAAATSIDRAESTKVPPKATRGRSRSEGWSTGVSSRCG